MTEKIPQNLKVRDMSLTLELTFEVSAYELGQRHTKLRGLLTHCKQNQKYSYFLLINKRWKIPQMLIFLIT
jgi:hypothetical protein